jgi:nitroreductase
VKAKENAMDFLELIRSRRSIRAFEGRVPSREVINECLEAAVWAPNATNQQPWEFVVAAGKELEKIIEVIEENFAQRMGERDPFSDMPDHCAARQQEIMATLIQVAQEEGLDPNSVFQKSLRFFGAPVAVYFITYKRKDNQYCLSTTAALENFLLAAEAKGLGTCWLGVSVVCEEDIKEHLGIPNNKEILGGVALGYPDRNSPFNTFKRSRVPVADVTAWLGF